MAPTMTLVAFGLLCASQTAFAGEMTSSFHGGLGVAYGGSVTRGMIAPAEPRWSFTLPSPSLHLTVEHGGRTVRGFTGIFAAPLMPHSINGSDVATTLALLVDLGVQVGRETWRT